MHRRYIDALTLRFDQIADQGFTTITRQEVMRWWDRQRETPTIWDDLLERWNAYDFHDEEGDPIPLIASDHNGVILLCRADDWLVPLSDWTS